MVEPRPGQPEKTLWQEELQDWTERYLQVIEGLAGQIRSSLTPPTPPPAFPSGVRVVQVQTVRPNSSGGSGLCPAGARPLLCGGGPRSNYQVHDLLSQEWCRSHAGSCSTRRWRRCTSVHGGGA